MLRTIIIDNLTCLEASKEQVVLYDINALKGKEICSL